MKPAARLTDLHTCPMVTPGTPPIPHVGGPVSGPGAIKTLIAGLPAARLGDLCVCVGPPDTIVLGSFVCFIEGKPAARMGDMSAHGGVITLGCPTVLIGDRGGAGSPQAAAMKEGRKSATGYVRAGLNHAAARAMALPPKPPGPPTAGPNKPQQRATPTAWLEVEIRDDRGYPVHGELVRATDADGDEHERFTGPDGVARFEGLPEGNADVTLPRLDRDTWRRA